MNATRLDPQPSSKTPKQNDLEINILGIQRVQSSSEQEKKKSLNNQDDVAILRQKLK
jgi:hypothetical protein